MNPYRDPRDPIEQLHVLAWMEAIHAASPMVDRATTWMTMQLFMYVDPEGFEEFVHETVAEPETFIRVARANTRIMEKAHAARWN